MITKTSLYLNLINFNAQKNNNTHQYAQQPANNTLQEHKKNNKHGLVEIIAILTGIATAIGGVYFLIRKCKSPNKLNETIPKQTEQFGLKIEESIQQAAIKTKEIIQSIALNKDNHFRDPKTIPDNEAEDIFAVSKELYDAWDSEWAGHGNFLREKKGHKAIFAAFDIIPKEMSDLHRNIESLYLCFFPFLRKNDANYTELIPQLAQKILDDGVLDKFCKAPQKLIRNDIPEDINEWVKLWRGQYRDIDRPTNDISEIRKILSTDSK